MANKNTQQNNDRKIVLAIPLHLANVSNVMLAGVQYTTADLVKLFQGRIDASDQSTAAHAKWLDLVKAEREERAQTAVVVRAFKDLVLSMFADQAGPLADFGLTPRKKPKKTVATKSQAVAQTKATRTARKTLGKRQKAKVKGVVQEPRTTTSSSASGAGAPAAGNAGASSGGSNAAPAPAHGTGTSTP
jgi:hypothetical protein